MTKLYISSLDQNFHDLTGKAVNNSKYVLCTFFYLQKLIKRDKELAEIVKQYNSQDKFILDSGAFSFMNGKKITEQKLDDYCQEYMEFVKKYQIKRYVELDIDAVLGFQKALEYRNYLEKNIGYATIPIFHKSRGKNEFVKMCEQYSYAGIGGIAIKDITPKEHKYFKQLNLFANSQGCKLHAMGFTPTKDLNSYGFYSCDSSSWTMGVRFGNLYRFTGNKIKSIKKPPNTKLNLSKSQIQTFNWNEWCKYQKFVDKG